MTVISTGQPAITTVTPLPPEPALHGRTRSLEGAHIILVHGFGSTPSYNWERTRWVSQIRAHGATVHTVVLPYHQVPGSSEATFSATTYELPCSQQKGFGALADALAGYVRTLDGDIHLVGYSVGARICWNIAAHSPGLMTSLVVGAMPLTNHLPIIHRALTTGCPVPENFTEILAGSPIPVPQLIEFAALASEHFSLTPAPTCPTLFFRGEDDTVAHDIIQAYTLLAPGQGTWLEYPKRDHISILTSGKLRASVIEFMVRHRPGKASGASA